MSWGPNYLYTLVLDALHAAHGGGDGGTSGTPTWDLRSVRILINGGECVVARTTNQFMRAMARFGLPATCMCVVGHVRAMLQAPRTAVPVPASCGCL